MAYGAEKLGQAFGHKRCNAVPLNPRQRLNIYATSRKTLGEKSVIVNLVSLRWEVSLLICRNKIQLNESPANTLTSLCDTKKLL
jgi:PIN domain nuclease of toxin-antitoxin system